MHGKNLIFIELNCYNCGAYSKLLEGKNQYGIITIISEALGVRNKLNHEGIRAFQARKRALLTMGNKGEKFTGSFFFLTHYLLSSFYVPIAYINDFT